MESEDSGQGGWRRMSLKGGVRLQKLGHSGGGKRVLGGDIERWAGKTMRLRELGGEKEREEDLSFASSTGYVGMQS